VTSSERRRLRRERCAAKYAARSFAEEVRRSASGHNGHSGTAFAVGGELVNVHATRAHAGSSFAALMRGANPPKSGAPSVKIASSKVRKPQDSMSTDVALQLIFAR